MMIRRPPSQDPAQQASKRHSIGAGAQNSAKGSPGAQDPAQRAQLNLIYVILSYLILFDFGKVSFERRTVVLGIPRGSHGFPAVEGDLRSSNFPIKKITFSIIHFFTLRALS